MNCAGFMANISINNNRLDNKRIDLDCKKWFNAHLCTYANSQFAHDAYFVKLCISDTNFMHKKCFTYLVKFKHKKLNM